MATGTTHRGRVTKAIRVYFRLMARGIWIMVTILTGWLINVTMDTPIMACSSPTSTLMRDINSPVLLREKKLRGWLSKCSNNRARRSQVARIPTQFIKYELK